MPGIRRVTAAAAPETPSGQWSNCLVVDRVAYISGLVCREEESMDGQQGPDDCAQARVIFAKMKALIQAAGGQMSDIVKITVYVTDIRRREQVWAARSEFFTGDFPASTLIEVSNLAEPRVTVEIEAIAHIGASTR